MVMAMDEDHLRFNSSTHTHAYGYESQIIEQVNQIISVFQFAMPHRKITPFRDQKGDWE